MFYFLLFLGWGCSYKNFIKLQLKSDWGSNDLKLHTIESIAGIDENKYILSVLSVLNIHLDEYSLENEDFLENEDTDEKTLLRTLKVVKSEEDRELVSFDISNKIYTPRIQTHYDHYSLSFLKKYGEKKKQHELKKGEKIKAWIVYGNQVFFLFEDLFAMQFKQNSIGELEDFDRVIGNNTKSDIVFLYGDHTTKTFRDFFKMLYQESLEGKLRFVWRYTPLNDKKVEGSTLSGYGVKIFSKKQDKNISIDFNEIPEYLRSYLDLKKSNKDLSNKTIEMRFLSFLLLKDKKFGSAYERLNEIYTNLPLYHSLSNYILELPNEKNVTNIFNKNLKLGITTKTYGFYVNGSPVHSSNLDINIINNKIRQELKFIRELMDLGFTPYQSKLIISTFAVKSALKKSFFLKGNSVLGSNENRFRVYKFNCDKKKSLRNGVIFFNDIENDSNYNDFSSDRNKTYFDINSFGAKNSQIPLLKENIYDIIFAINLNDKNQLKTFFFISKIILNNRISQQIGLIPLEDKNPVISSLIKKLYFLSETTSSIETLAFLYKYLETDNNKSVNDFLKLVNVPDSFNFNFTDHQKILKRFSIEFPSVIINGVFYNLNGLNLELAIHDQCKQDVDIIKNYITNNPFSKKSLKDVLYSDAKFERNTRITENNYIYKLIDKSLFDLSMVYKRKHYKNNFIGTFWLIGNFDHGVMISQLINLLTLMKKQSIDFQIRILNTGTNLNVFKKLEDEFEINDLSNDKIDNIIFTLSNHVESNLNRGMNITILKTLQEKFLPSNHNYLLFNSRYFRLDNLIFTTDELESLINFQLGVDLNPFSNFLNQYLDEFKINELINSNKYKFNKNDWFDLFSSVVFNSFYFNDDSYITGTYRFDLNSIDLTNSIDVNKYDKNKKIDIILIIDSLGNESQKLVSIVNSIKDFVFLNVKIYIHPNIISNNRLVLNSFYLGVYPSFIIKFDENGKWKSDYYQTFNKVSKKTYYDLNIDCPNKWICSLNYSSEYIDLNKIHFTELKSNTLELNFKLKNILLHGFLINVSTGKRPSNFELTLKKNKIFKSITSTSAFGIFQLIAETGTFNLILNGENDEDMYTILSVSDNKYDVRNNSLDLYKINVFDFRDRNYYIKIKKSVNLNIHSDKRKNYFSKLKSIYKYITKKEKNEINVFTISSGYAQEKLLENMIVSLLNNTDSNIKFWILENFLSLCFKKRISILSKQYKFNYNLIHYKWLNFLKKQKKIEKSISGYKILFLDLIFPKKIKKIIFINPDLFLKDDVKNLIELDLGGAPYGFVPSCESKDKIGPNCLINNSQKANDNIFKSYDNSLFVIDLVQFRKLNAGDKLRLKYQFLSSNSAYIENLNQDLINGLQKELKIFSLPQEWLWSDCCYDEKSMSSAKAVKLFTDFNIQKDQIQSQKKKSHSWMCYENQVNESFVMLKNKSKKNEHNEL